MQLNAEIEKLRNRVEVHIRKSVERDGTFEPFALVLRADGSEKAIEAPDPFADFFKALGDLLDTLKPLAASGAIRASAICTLMPGDEDRKTPDTAVIDLEHQDQTHVLCFIPFYKRFLVGWKFDPIEAREERPRLFAPRQQSECLEVSHAEFTLKLGGGWTQHPSPDANLFALSSEEKQTHVVVSVLQTGEIPLEKLLGAANEFADSRIKAEKEARPGEIQFGDCLVEPKENGQIVYVAYAGYDGNSIFRFTGWVTQRKIVSLSASTQTRNNDFSKAVFDEVFRGFQFMVP
jgi:hypothetical protein